MNSSHIHDNKNEWAANTEQAAAVAERAHGKGQAAAELTAAERAASAEQAIFGSPIATVAQEAAAADRVAGGGPIATAVQDTIVAERVDFAERRASGGPIAAAERVRGCEPAATVARAAEGGGYAFFAMLARMKHINRWGLMRNTRSENVQEHSLQVAMIAHALAVISNLHFGGDVDADRAAVVGMFHDCDEILTGDLPTPIKYFNGRIRKAYREVEAAAAGKLLSMLPGPMRDVYGDILAHEVGGNAAGGAHDAINAAGSAHGASDSNNGYGSAGGAHDGGNDSGGEFGDGGTGGAHGANDSNNGYSGAGNAHGIGGEFGGAGGAHDIGGGIGDNACGAGETRGDGSPAPRRAGGPKPAEESGGQPQIARFVKAADSISAHIKCIEELAMGNSEFRAAAEATRKKIEAMGLPEADMFMRDFIGAFSLSLDEFGI